MWETLKVMMFFFFQAEDGIRDKLVTGVQTCALPICLAGPDRSARRGLGSLTWNNAPRRPESPGGVVGLLGHGTNPLASWGLGNRPGRRIGALPLGRRSLRGRLGLSGWRGEGGAGSLK